MLIQFTVGNFKSFKEKATLSLEADHDEWLAESNVSNVHSLRLLNAAAIYGANASGKSNFLSAMERFRNWVQKSSKDSQAGDKIPVVPYRLHTGTEKAPTFFEVVFLKNARRFRYGFEATRETIQSEWLFGRADSIRETRLFTREGGNIERSEDFKEAKGLEKLTRPNALFLSVSAQFNGPVAAEVIAWMNQFRSISGLDDKGYMPFTAAKLGEEAFAPAIRELSKRADLGIEDLQARVAPPLGKQEELILKDIPGPAREEIIRGTTGNMAVKTFHRRFGPGDQPAGLVEFDFKAESAGTQKFVALTGPFLHTLQEGSVLFVDELEARLHPLLTKALVGLFNSSANAKHAQLIFATHDEGLLDPKRIRRDQVWFVEKDDYGASRLYSLAEFKGVRKGAKFAKEYLLGQFGGIPHVGDFEETLTHGGE
jgi:hypothetical protein